MRKLRGIIATSLTLAALTVAALAMPVMAAEPVIYTATMAETLTLKVGEKTKLSYELTPKASKPKVSWKSSAPKIAGVSSAGQVSAKSAGTATITLRVLPKGQKTWLELQCLVTVEPKVKPAAQDEQGEDVQPDDLNARTVIELVNKARTAEGLKPYKVDQALMEVAALRAKEHSVCYGHTRPDGSEWNTAFPYKSCSENLGRQPRLDAADMFKSWMESSGHKKNILHTGRTYIGVGYCRGSDGKYYWALAFAKK